MHRKLFYKLNKVMKKIETAAIKFKQNVILTGRTHSDIYDKAMEMDLKYSEAEEGFITTDNEFVDRITAAKIAKESGQITDNFHSLKSWMIN